MVWFWLMINVFMWLLLGRLIGLHAQRGRMPRPWLRDTGVTLTAGASVWALWWVVLVPLLGGGTWVALALFALLALGMSGVMYRTWHHPTAEDQTVAHIAAAILLLLPLLALVGTIWPALQAWPFHQLLAQLVNVGGWPNATQLAAMAFAPRTTGSGWLALNLAVTHAGVAPWQAAAGLSLAAMLGLASTLRTVLELPLRWSNLLLLTAGMLAVTFICYPVPVMAVLTGATPLAWSLLAMLVAAVPLLSSQPLPVGLSTLPPALALALLVQLQPVGLPVAVLVLLLWLLRQGVEKQAHQSQPTAALLAGWSVLLTLPLIAAALTLLYGGAAGAVSPLTHAAGFWAGWKEIFAAQPQIPTAPLPWQLTQLLFAAAVVAWAGLHLLTTRRPKGVLALLSSHAWLVLPGCMLVLLVAFGLLAGRLPQVLPFIVLWAALPVWRQSILIYRSTRLQAWAFRAPWRLGLVCAIGFWVWQQAISRPNPPLLAASLLQAAQIAGQAGQVQAGQPVALMAPASVRPWVAYGLATAAPTLPVAEAWPSLAHLHQSLRKAGAASLVVALPTPGQQQALGLTPEVLMATFHTTPQGLTLTGVTLNPLAGPAADPLANFAQPR